MPYKLRGRTVFRFDESTEAVCHWQYTSYGFRHIAELKIHGVTECRASAPYYNRTWESYEYQSVLYSLVEKARKQRLFTKEMAEAAEDLVRSQFRREEEAKINREFSMIGMVAKLGEILCPTYEQSNAWKLRMVKAGLGEGFIVPDDWDSLSEEEKGGRLDKVLEMLKQPAL